MAPSRRPGANLQGFGPSARPSSQIRILEPRHKPRKAQGFLAILAFFTGDYATVDDRLVWGVVERDLPGLRETVVRLLGGGEGP